MPEQRRLKVFLTLAVGSLMGVAVAAAGLAFNHPATVSMTLTGPGTPAELFYNLGEQGFHQTRTEAWRLPDDEPTTLRHSLHGVRPLTAIRVDPAQAPGKHVDIAEVRVETPWRTWEAQGDALLASLRRHHDLQINGIDDKALQTLSTGADPQLIIDLPTTAIERPASVTYRLLIAGGAGGLLLTALGLAIRPLIPARRRPRPGIIMLAGAILLLTLQSWPLITDKPIYGDGAQNAVTTYNLWKHGVFSHASGSPPPPSNWREPLPAMAAAIWLQATMPEREAVTAQSLSRGEHSIDLKRSNLIWIALGLIGCAWLVQRLTGSVYASLSALLLSWLYFFGFPERIDTFYTELQAGTLMLWSGIALHGLATTRNWRWALTAGVLMGLMALTKGIMLYVALVAIPLFVLVLRPKPQTSLGVIGAGLVMALGTALVITPWMTRNMMLLDESSVTDRGGLILYGRSVLNQMRNEEIPGVFYLYGPQLYKTIVAGTQLGPIGNDFERGGRWQRLNRGASSFAGADLRAQAAGRPEDAISFHRRVGAEYNRRIQQHRDDGHPRPRLAAGAGMQRDAIDSILSNPGRHLVMSIPCLWRGYWGLPDADLPALSVQRQTFIQNMLNLTGGAALIGLFLTGLLARRGELVGWTLMAGGTIAAYAMLTHSIPRYMAPTHPLMMIALVVVGWYGLQVLARGAQRISAAAG
ncbi:glycosyltransferase family 39 protein [Spiribacter pallidus]|uniref:Glycosyltransferase family 39 protein n=1 Tax=Spiribacter pallidus TaxID=1987936 RepID=A0ABV3TCP4_9GAMM